jgi:site-specific recombinase XerD
MLDTFVIQDKVRTRMKNGPLGSYLSEYAAALNRQGYSKETIRQYLHAADQFGVWLVDQGIPLANLSDTDVGQYQQGFGVQFFPSRSQSGLPSRIHGLKKLAEFLKQKGFLRSNLELKQATGINKWLEDFDQHLDRVAGYTRATRHNYIYFARRLFNELCRTGEPDWSAFQSERITDYMCQEASRVQASSCIQHVTAIRAFLRFLAMRGVIPAGLEGAVPSVPTWRYSSLPRHISLDEVERVINACDLATPLEVRDRAIIILLARLGLRAGEVLRLQLDDINWSEGYIAIRPGKNHSERRLPLSQEVGDALVKYLKGARPAGTERELFLCSRPPFLPLRSTHLITRMVGKALKRAGVTLPRSGAHILRHTLATGMAQQGTTFKEIADVLGHRSLASTFIYAKLDLESLGKVAIPWPGGAR